MAVVITEQQKDEIVRRHVEGRENLSEIGRRFGVTRERIRQIVRERGVSTLTRERWQAAAETRRVFRAVAIAARMAHTQRHGTMRRYSMGCRCDPCRAANAAYHRERWQRLHPGAHRRPPEDCAAISAGLRAARTRREEAE